ncbi:Vascular cell adhesion protein 1 [Bagarius yarrelli]|uniref:Vascular cell adhesion protein 1 n=1 Tax=Bagarius yarrelli TaxID=175774 RepID=A0A556UF12_BAGYA|nr:Vascular cell adhesion protein 1 [Bagarius yarrelli]
MGWEASQGSVRMQKNVQFITWSVEKLKEWDIRPMCFINANRQEMELLKITVYKPPDSVFISTKSNVELMFEANEYELKCNVQNVAPVQLLNVKWYKGDQLINTKEFSEDNDKFPANKTTTIQIIPNRNDDGVQYRCEAELKLGPDGPHPPPKLTSDPLNITVHYPPSTILEPQAIRVSAGEDVVLKCASNAKPRPRYDWFYHKASNVFIKDQDGVSLLHITHAGGAEPSCPLSVDPPRVLLEYGDTISVKCLTNATDSSLIWIFDKRLISNDTLVINSTLLSDFLDGNLKAMCHGTFIGLDFCEQDVDVTIYNPPEKVSIGTLDHTGPMIEGNNYTLRCDIRNVAPVHLLTVNWYKGKYHIKNESFPSGTEFLANKTATLTIFPSRNDNITSYSCEAELQLPLKNPIKVKSNPFNITVYYKPAIHKKSPQWVPVFHGYSEVLVCKASGYPEPTITWIYNNEIFKGENLTVKENVGEYTCIASNSVGNDTRVVNVVLKEDYLPLIAGFVALVVVIISVFFISIYSIYYKNTKMGHYTVEGATPKAQNGNVARNGKDSTLPMKKFLM